MRTLLLILALVAAPAQAVTLRWAAQNDILTLDRRGFSTYRTGKGKALRLVP